MRAQYYLGMMFLNGHGGVTASTEKAVRPAPRAASRGGAPGPPRDHPLAHAVGNQEAERERLYTSLAALLLRFFLSISLLFFLSLCEPLP